MPSYAPAKTQPKRSRLGVSLPLNPDWRVRAVEAKALLSRLPTSDEMIKAMQELDYVHHCPTLTNRQAKAAFANAARLLLHVTGLSRPRG